MCSKNAAYLFVLRYAHFRARLQIVLSVVHILLCLSAFVLFFDVLLGFADGLDDELVPLPLLLKLFIKEATVVSASLIKDLLLPYGDVTSWHPIRSLSRRGGGASSPDCVLLFLFLC